MKIILVTLFISLTSVLAFAWATNRPVILNTDNLAAEIKSLRQEMATRAACPKTTTNQFVPSLLDDDATPSGGLISVKDPKSPGVNVYLEKNLTSKIVARMEFGNNYPFISKDSDWYQVIVNSKTGFAPAQLVK